MGKSESGDNIKAYLPFSLLWTPISKGGVGMHPLSLVDPNVDIMLSMYNWGPRSLYEINLCIQAVKQAPSKDNSYIVEQVKPYLKDGENLMRECDYAVYLDKIKDSIKANDELTEKFKMKEDPAAYFRRYDQTIKEAIEDDRKMRKINVPWKRRRSRSIIRYFEDHYGENIDDGMGDMFVPGITFELKEEIVNYNLPCCPIAGLDVYLQSWFQQLGTSSEGRAITGIGFSKISALLNKGNFPRNLKANNVEAIASKLLELRIVEQNDIFNFLVMRGADRDNALLVATELSTKLDMLRHLAEVSAFSYISEGFTDKSETRISELVSTSFLIDNGTPFTRLIRAVAYQFIRMQPLWYVDDNGVMCVNKRRKVHIHANQDTLLSYYSKTFKVVGDRVLEDNFFKTFFFYNTDYQSPTFHNIL